MKKGTAGLIASFILGAVMFGGAALGAPAMSVDIVGRGGAAERADNADLLAVELSAVRDYDAAGIIANLTTSKILVDGEEISVTAYNIEGRNYLQLRDMAAAVDFSVVWDGGGNRVHIDTGRGYDPNGQYVPETTPSTTSPTAACPTPVVTKAGDVIKTTDGDYTIKKGKPAEDALDRLYLFIFTVRMYATRKHDMIAECLRSAFSSHSDSTAEKAGEQIAAVFLKGEMRGMIRKLLNCAQFVNEFVSEFGRALVSEFGREFGREFVSEFVSELGREFGRAFGRAFGCELGRVFGSAVLRSRFFVLRLLYNDDWSWILWLSHYARLRMDTFLSAAQSYYAILPGASTGFGFRNMHSVTELLTAPELHGPWHTLDEWVLYKLRFLRYMHLVRLDRQNGELIATLRQNPLQPPSYVQAADDAIKAFFRSLQRPQILCFDTYPSLGLVSDHWEFIRFQCDFKGNFYTSLPKEVENIPLLDYLKKCGDPDSAIQTIMESEQAVNIMDYTYLNRADKQYTHADIERDYRQMIADYVNANMENRETE